MPADPYDVNREEMLAQVEREKRILSRREKKNPHFSIDRQYIYLVAGVLAGYTICFFTMGS